MSLTAANATILLAIPGLYSTPQQLQGFAADDVFTNEPVESAEVLMGVDGLLSGGFVYVPVRWGITLQADSKSNAVFDKWVQQQQANKDAYTANGVVLLTTLGKKWTMTKGFLTTFPYMPDAKKLLQPRKYGITWESVSPSVV